MVIQNGKLPTGGAIRDCPTVFSPSTKTNQEHQELDLCLIQDIGIQRALGTAPQAEFGEEDPETGHVSTAPGLRAQAPSAFLAYDFGTRAPRTPCCPFRFQAAWDFSRLAKLLRNFATFGATTARQ
jgi:hypothetical protein